ncbi:hypothetical protein QE152_g26393 [Popillia japonica]|uniref:Caspase-8 N-terminal domain-containing protein n=1 Tax=Popillia japonica TaxID=7064 RepID=A0AAW1JXE4_POPJA
MISEQNSHFSDSDESEYHSAESDMGEDYYLTSDAVDSKQPSALVKDITINDVQTIYDMLNLYEKVSLIFLLYRTPYAGLQHIILLLQNAQINVLEEWCSNEIKINSKWAEKLLEGLTIIQNYAALKKLGILCNFKQS